MITLRAWTIRENVNYAVAHKRFVAGEIPGAEKVGNRILVPDDLREPPRSTVRCRVCDAEFPQITATHLRKHQMTFDEYVIRFPGVETCSAEVGEKISGKLIGRSHTDEHRANNSAAAKGRDVWNKGLVGVIKDSPETVKRKSEAQLGRKHSEETKQAIGDAHRGKTLSLDQIDGLRAATKKYIEENGPPFKGRHHTEASNLAMTEKALLREALRTKDERIAINLQRGDANRGLKRTDEQKETYRAARCKFMSENPMKTKDTTGECSVKTLLNDLGIKFVQQFLIPGLHHPYDFYIPDFNTIIEFDGAHHWLAPWFNIAGKSQDEKDQMLVKQKSKDAYETAFAEEKGFRVIRVFGIMDVGDAPGLEPLEEQLLAQGFLQEMNVSTLSIM